MKISLKIFFILIFSAVFLFFSCSNAKPEIKYGFIQSVLLNNTAEGPKEHFSFFIIPHDDDGIENLDELHLYHDREQLRWIIKSGEWITLTQDGSTWIGTRSITSRETYLPRGVFRAVLVNKGGDSTERYFTFDGNARYAFPEIEISGGIFNVNSAWPVNKLIGYDSSGSYAATVNLSSMSGNVSDLGFSSNVRSAALWAEDVSSFCAAITNIISIRD